VPEKLTSYPLPDEFECPICQAKLVGASPVTAGAPKGFRKGHISVCGHCASYLIMGDSMYRQLEQKEVDKLPPETRQQLAMIRSLIEKRIAVEKTKEN
jgi:hypothetical protein